MKPAIRYMLGTISLVGAWFAQAGATNSIIIESKTVTVGSQSIPLGIYLTNDQYLVAAVLPLEFRSLTAGCYMRDSLRIATQGRVAEWESRGSYISTAFFASKSHSSDPRPSVCPGDSTGNSWVTHATNPDFSSPDAALYATVGIDSLPAGTDGQPGSGTPSFMLTFNVTDVAGQFRIDTACIYPANRLVYLAGPSPTRVTPAFTPGIITIAEPVDTLSGHVTQNLSLRGTVYLPGDLTIDSGVTVNVRPGTVFRAFSHADTEANGFDSTRTEIIVKGTLAVDQISGDHPVFASTADSSGTWYGIRIMPGGHFETGIGATIQNAVVGVSIALGAPADTLSKLAIRHCQTGIHNGGGAVALLQDTVIGIPGSIGIFADSAAPLIKSCVIESCGTGIKARFSSSTIRGTKIFGPGQHGVQIDDDFLQMQGVERQGLVHAASGEGSPASDVYMIADTISGYFSSAQLVMEWASGKCTIDSCGFVHPAGSTRSPYGLLTNTADTLTMHHSEVTGYSSYGLYSLLSHIDIGKGSTNGNNSIFTDTSGCGGCLARRVYHSTMRTDTLKAEGNWWGTDNPSASWFSAKVDWNPYLTSPPSGKLATPDDGAEQAALPTEFTLSQNYPNPFNAGTQIEFSLATAQEVEVRVYNILGQVVRVLTNDRMEAGRHAVTWDGRNRDGEVLASGIYLYRLIAGDFVETKKMVLLK